MNYNFNEVIDRSSSHSTKWEGFQPEFPGLDVEGALPMWVADMDFRCSDEIIHAIVQRAEHGIYGYNSKPGLRKFYEATAEWVKKHYSWKVDPDWMTFAPGIVPAIYIAVQAFTKPGDGIITLTPVYDPFLSAIERNERVNRTVPLLEKDGYYTIDFDLLERTAKEPGTKMMIQCSPHNPVGRVWTREELDRICRICIDNDVLLFSDEIHADLVFEGHSHLAAASLSPEYESHLITGYSCGKTFNLAGLQTAAIVIKNDVLRERYNAQFARNGLSATPNSFGAVASEVAYRTGDEYLKQLLSYLQGNIDFAYDFTQKHLPHVKFRKPEGTYLIWMDFRELGLSAEELDALVLEKAKVVMDPGWWFGPEGKGFMRLNLACPRSLVEEGLRRLEKAISSLPAKAV